MILCFTGYGESRMVGDLSMSAMWVARARTLGVSVLVDQATSVASASQSISALPHDQEPFDHVYFVGHGSQASFHFLGLVNPFTGGIVSPPTASLNAVQLDSPGDPMYVQTVGFLQRLATVLPAQGSRIVFECCSFGTLSNLSKIRTVLQAAGRDCTVQGYPIRVNWILAAAESHGMRRVQLHEGANRMITAGATPRS